MGFYFSLFGLDWVMLRRVVDLFACWRGQFDSLHNVTLWKMILSFLMWCIWSGEKEITVVLKTMRGNGELKDFFCFYTLYRWVTAYDYFHFSSSCDFSCSFFTSCVLGLH
jgi:hypothetical protein